MTYVYVLLVLSMLSTVVWGRKCMRLIQEREEILEVYPKRVCHTGDRVFVVDSGTYWRVDSRQGHRLPCR
jgi:hypothetical protein